MFSHIMIGADDVEVSKKFYDAVLATVGVSEGTLDPKGRIFYRTSSGVSPFRSLSMVSRPVAPMAARLGLPVIPPR